MTVRLTPEADPLRPLWRAAQVFRLASLAYAIGALVSIDSRLDRPLLAWSLMAAQTAWTGMAVTYLSQSRPRQRFVIADIVITCALILASWLVSSPDSWQHQDALPTVLWATNAIVSASLQWGRRVGFVVSLVVALLANLVSGSLYTSVWQNATIPVLASVSLAIGTVAHSVTRANDQLRAATELRAAAEERDRLARAVHDGALQVLALVGRSDGTVDAGLAEAARTQERALRSLLASTHTRFPSGDRASSARATRSGEEVDLGRALTELADGRTQVSAPQDPVILPADRAEPLLLAVHEALHNARQHAGPYATAYVLLEDLTDEVVVSVRDDGPGIPAGRLAAARREGRLGVCQSIEGRMRAAGGRAQLVTAAGEGTEWELHLPRTADATEDR